MIKIKSVLSASSLLSNVNKWESLCLEAEMNQNATAARFFAISWIYMFALNFLIGKVNVPPSQWEPLTWRLLAWEWNRLEIRCSGQHVQQCKQVWLILDHMINSLIPTDEESGGQILCVKCHVCSKWTRRVPSEPLAADSTLVFLFPAAALRTGVCCENRGLWPGQNKSNPTSQFIASTQKLAILRGKSVLSV